MRAPTGDRKSVVGDSRPEQRHPSIMVVRIAPWESGGQTAATASDRSDHRPGGRRPASGTKQQYAEGMPAGRDGAPRRAPQYERRPCTDKMTSSTATMPRPMRASWMAVTSSAWTPWPCGCRAERPSWRTRYRDSGTSPWPWRCFKGLAQRHGPLQCARFAWEVPEVEPTQVSTPRSVDGRDADLAGGPERDRFLRGGAKQTPQHSEDDHHGDDDDCGRRPNCQAADVACASADWPFHPESQVRARTLLVAGRAEPSAWHSRGRR